YHTAIRGEADYTMGLLINRVSTRSLTERITAPPNIGMNPTTNCHPDIAADHPRKRERPQSERLATPEWGLPLRRTA
ncbi:MAG: hypothetical protein ACC652_12495, partial [Acidimicrobiales bacterium]